MFAVSLGKFCIPPFAVAEGWESKSGFSPFHPQSVESKVVRVKNLQIGINNPARLTLGENCLALFAASLNVT